MTAFNELSPDAQEIVRAYPPKMAPEFLIDVCITVRAPDLAAANRLADELRTNLRDEKGVRAVNVCTVERFED